MMILSFAIVILMGTLFGSVCQRLNLPRLIGYLLTGLLFGPYIFNGFDAKFLSISSEIRQIALLIILLQAGLSLDVSDLRKMGKKAILMSFVPACFEMTATFFVAQFIFGLPPLDAAILGAIIASASPAVIVPRMLRLMKEGYGTEKAIPQLILTGDSIDDVFNIVVFSSLLSLHGGANISLFQIILIPISVILGIGLGILVGYVLRSLLVRLEGHVMYQVLTVFGVSCLLVSLEPFVEIFIPFSALISIMASGVTLLKLEPTIADSVSHVFSRIWIGAEMFLFALVGASVDIRLVGVAGVGAILMLIIVLMVRAIGINACLIGSGFTRKERVFCMITGIPKATVQAAIGGIPLAMGFANGGLILAIAVIAIITTAPFGAYLIDNSYKHLLTKSM
ncbi:hypothetical protein G7062_03925 [Erysipelothrix sp. HDW6C]|uniref:cation:proton antiporter domain-containing protein n=1 Tax=Erysipelothrix sp. HDW6C TaxID=2714930 RepID=UPI00140D3EC6|nr:cation:proton antiporter [Erysipelothrix sp. HDW6C]QIK69493.1 hypothetical protein G7062_03925 [Erysipelothrix sp. HDW6C]